MLLTTLGDMETSVGMPKSDFYFKHATVVMSNSIIFVSGRVIVFAPKLSNPPTALSSCVKKIPPLQKL